MEISTKTAVSNGDVEGTRTSFLLKGSDNCITAMLHHFSFADEEVDYLMFQSVCERKGISHNEVIT